MIRRNPALAGTAILLLMLATACSVGGQPQAAPLAVSPATLTVTETTTVQVPSSEPVFLPPDGFDDWGDRLAAKWTDRTTYTCADSAESCWGVDLYSERGCTGGILVVLDVFRDQTKLTVLDGTTAAVTPGATVILVLGQTGNGSGLTAKIATISCLA